MKNRVLKFATALLIQVLVLLIIVVALRILGLGDLPGWAFAAIGSFIFCVALAAQSELKARDQL